MKQTNNRENILNCALHLFSTKGYDGVSVNEITEMAEITKPTLYYFFGSKEGLFKELLKNYYSQLNDSLTKASVYRPDIHNYENDIYPVLLETAKMYFRFAAKNTEFYMMILSLMFAPHVSEPAKMAEEYHKVQYALLEKTFYDFSAAHGNLKGKEKMFSLRFLAMINAQIGFWRRGHTTISEFDAEMLVKQFMHGIFA